MRLPDAIGGVVIVDAEVKVGAGEDDASFHDALELAFWQRFGAGASVVIVIGDPEALNPVIVQALQQILSIHFDSTNQANQLDEQRDTRDDAALQYVFIGSMIQAADGTQAIEGGHASFSGKGAIGSAARADPAQLKTEASRRPNRQPLQASDLVCARHRRRSQPVA